MDEVEKIISIEEVDPSEESYENMSGYIVKTTVQEIFLGISNVQACCEDWGYLWCNDDLNDFIGAQLLNVKVTNELGEKCICTQKINDAVSGVYEGLVMFVTFETDRGDLQFVAYNAHNGSYSHRATVKCDQVQHETIL